MQFLERWCLCDIKAFYVEIGKPTADTSDLDYIELAKHFEWSKYGAGETVHVSGVRESQDKGVIRYGIDFIPVNRLAHLPVRLHPEIDISKDRKK